MKKTSTEPAVLEVLEAIFYGRYSSDRQGKIKGKEAISQSESRQRKAYAAVLSRYPHRLKLSTRFPNGFFDEAKSAFKNKHVTEGDLGKLLAMARRGELAGSCLVFDEWSRFSRIAPDLANRQLSELVRAGVPVVVNEGDMFVDDAFLSSNRYIQIQFYLQMAHEKSATISYYGKGAWEDRRERNDNLCPCWLVLNSQGEYDFASTQETVGGFAKLPAETLRKAIELSLKDYGTEKIIEKLNLVGKEWKKLHVLFRMPELMGMSQSYDNDGDAIGEPRQKYPALITEGVWNQLQNALDSRRTTEKVGKGGRDGEGVANLFQCLIVNEAGQPMIVTPSKGRRVLVPNTKRGQRLQYPLVESALLKFLDELSPADVSATDDTSAKDLERLKGEESRLARLIEQWMENDDASVAIVKEKVKRLSAQLEGVKVELADCRRKSEDSKADTLAGIKTLTQLLASTPAEQLPELRRNLRGKIRGIVRTITAQITTSKDFTLLAELVSGHRRYILVKDGNVVAIDDWKCTPAHEYPALRIRIGKAGEISALA